MPLNNYHSLVHKAGGKGELRKDWWAVPPKSSPRAAAPFPDDFSELLAELPLCLAAGLGSLPRKLPVARVPSGHMAGVFSPDEETEREARDSGSGLIT